MGAAPVLLGGSVRDAAHKGTFPEEDFLNMWSWDRKDPQRLDAKWDNGAVATLRLEKLGRDIVVTRHDTSGASAGIEARYEGVWSGHSLSGTVSWTRDGKTTSGTWNVDLSRNVERGPHV